MHDADVPQSSNGSDVGHGGAQPPSAMLDRIEAVLKGLHPTELRQLVQFMEALAEAP